MALTSPLRQFYMKPLPGMNTKQEDLELGNTVVELVQNGRFENEPGSVIKRDPTSKYNPTTMGAGKPVMGMRRFYRTDGSIKTVAVCDQSVFVGTDATGAMTALSLPAGFTLTENKRMAFEVYQDLLIMCNGSDNIIAYDGSSDNVCWELGSCKAVVGDAGNPTLTSVSYQITMENDAYICGAVSNEIAAVTSEKIDLTNIPIGPAATTNRKIYRKDNLTGGAYKYVATIADNYTTTYSDDIADVSGQAALGAVTDDMPKGNMLRVYRERLFIAGDPNEPNRIYYSNPYAPWYIQQTTNLDYMEIDKDDGDTIMGIPIIMGTICCMKRNTIRKIHISLSSGSWASDGGFQLSSGGPESWYADDPIAFTGPVAQWSVLQTQIGILFLGWNHWYQFDGARVTPVIDEFDTGEILPSRYFDTVAHFSEGVLLWGYTDNANANTYHDTVGRYNFFRKALSIDKFTRYDSSTLVTKKTGVNCFASYDGDDEAGDIYYGDSRDGFIYRAEDTPQWIRWNKKSQLLDSTVDDVYIGGTEDNSWFEVGWDITIDELTQTNVTPTGAETAWAIGTDYAKGDVVLHGGSEYVADVSQHSWETAYGYANNEIVESDGAYYKASSAHFSAASTEPGVGVDWATKWGLVDLEPGVGADWADAWSLDVTALSIDNLPGVCNRGDTDGTITFNSMQINAGSLTDLYWNVRESHPSDTIIFSVRTGDTQAACELAAWTALGTTPPASMAAITGNVWFQLKCDLTCNSITGSPRVYYSDGYIMKFNYRIGGTIAENEVEFIYDTGWRHFDLPFVDKIWKKIGVWWEGEEGTVTIDWWTENSSGSFTVDLTEFPERWESFFPSTAMGRKLRLRVYKNDIAEFKLKEFSGVYTPEPVII